VPVQLRPDLDTVIANSPEVQAAIKNVCGLVHAAAVRRATAHTDSGHYLSELKIVGNSIIAGAYYSNWVEYGTCARRSPLAPTPCPHPEPKKSGIKPQFIMTGAIMDVCT